ncbi:hypothetical protein [Planococcus salinarum]|uniref:hypothetical protein n=1 Tax=Planococcus salinarum TaxID=622695 RepID=UPI000E3B7018|nr:hypothetical protein [Planococcus salinarum]TAA72150.1 hypothetical protein D2909_08125 [Planococcus salinarum]
MHKQFSIGLIIFSVFIFCNFPMIASAEADITIDAEAGFQNKVKYNRGVPVQITASNNGTAFSGDLVLDYSESYNIGAGLTLPLDLAAGESKTLQVSLPGMMDNSYSGGVKNQTIFLYEDGWEEGRSIDFRGSKSLTPNYFNPEVLFIAAMTENADRLRGLGELLPVGGVKAQVFHFNQQSEMQLPADALAWDTLDYLIIDDFPYSDLPDETQQAALTWLEQGGKIIVGAGSNLEATVGNLSDLLPLTLSSPSEKRVPGLENPVAVYQAKTNDGARSMIEDDGTIFAAKRTVGAGTIMQTAFSLGDEPVRSQPGYDELLMNLVTAEEAASYFQQDQSIKERMSYEIGLVNELFDSFAVSKTAMFFIILLYITVVVPVLYIILAKREKREFAWLAIPAIAILASLGIFAAGAKDRIANPQIQQTGFFEVDGDGGLSGYYMNTLLSNRSGDYQFSAPSTTTMTATSGDQFTGGSMHSNAILENGSQSSTLTVRDMRYWSVASIIGESYINGSGQFEIDLALENGKLSGTVRNAFPFAVHDTAIWTGTRLLSLGDFNPDEEKEITEMVQTDLMQPISPIGQTIGSQPMASEEELIEARKQSALAMSYEHLAESASSPYMIAYTNDAIIPVALESEEARVSAVHLLAQSFEPSLSFDGEVVIDSDDFIIEVRAVNPQIAVQEYPDNAYFYGLEPGEYRVQYQLPKALDGSNASWTKLDILSTAPDLDFSILRPDTGEFETLPNDSADLSENSGSYISEDGIIEIRLNKNQQTGYSEVTIPKIELEGEVQP